MRYGKFGLRRQAEPHASEKVNRQKAAVAAAARCKRTLWAEEHVPNRFCAIDSTRFGISTKGTNADR